MLHHVHHIVHVWDGLDTIIGQTLDIYGHKGWFHIMSHNEHTSPYNIPCRRGLLHYRTLWAGGKLWNINGTSQVAITFLVIVWWAWHHQLHSNQLCFPRNLQDQLLLLNSNDSRKTMEGVCVRVRTLF
jgi:hypothetical protein